MSVAWDANVEPGVIGYRVYIGTAPSMYSQAVNVGNVTTFAFQNGTVGQRYYFAVTAYAANGVDGPPSIEVSGVFGVTSGGGGGGGTTGGGGSTGGGGTSATPPSVSSGVTSPTPTITGPAVIMQPAAVNGGTVTVWWMPVGGLVATDYVLEAGSAAGLSNLYNASVGATTSVSADVGLGTYFVRVRGRSMQGVTTAPSNEISFTIGGAGIAGCTSGPAAPTDVTGSVVNGVASVGWSPAAGATSYLVQAGSAAGLSDFYYGDVGASTLVSAPVESGFHAFVRIIAVNACGQSAASTEVFIQ